MVACRMVYVRVPRGAGQEVWLVRSRDILDLDLTRAEALVSSMMASDGDRERLRSMIGATPELSDDELRALALERLPRADLVLVRLDQPRTLDEPKHVIIEPGIDDPIRPPVIQRPTWISLQVVLEDGGLIPGLPIALECPDGSYRGGNLDADSRYRADDIPAGDGGCTVKLHAHAGFAGPKTIAVAEGDVLVDPGAPYSVELACARHHRLVVVEGRTEIVLVDTAGKPVVERRCRVVVDGRSTIALTDEKGVVVAKHLRNAQVCEVDFPGLDRGVWGLVSGEAEVG